MKLLIATALVMSAFSNAQAAREKFYCTKGDPFTSGISKVYSYRVFSNNTVTGVFNSKNFSFKGVYSIKEENDVATWTNEDKKIVARLQLPSHYDGLQDRLWGKLTVDGKSEGMNCYRSY